MEYLLSHYQLLFRLSRNMDPVIKMSLCEVAFSHLFQIIILISESKLLRCTCIYLLGFSCQESFLNCNGNSLSKLHAGYDNLLQSKFTHKQQHTRTLTCVHMHRNKHTFPARQSKTDKELVTDINQNLKKNLQTSMSVLAFNTHESKTVRSVNRSSDKL